MVESMGLRYGEIISKMTLEEKARMMSGKNTWETVDFSQYGIPSMAMADGPHGLRRQGGSGDHLGLGKSLPATCFPTAATVANSWDEKLGEEIGEALAEEAVTMDVNVILGPGLNIKRSPLCGRNFEYFSEDPYHAGKMAAAYVRGIQSRGIAACPKHFAANSQELRRMAMNSVLDERTFREIYATGFEIAVKEGGAKALMTSYNEVNGSQELRRMAMNSVLDERTFREIYATGFEIAVKEGGAKALMTSYNEVNGVYANENYHLLREILVDEWGFDGYVVSDWGGSNDHALGVACGSHLEMPGTKGCGAKEILRAVADGTLTEEVLDERLDELLGVIFATHPATADGKEGRFDVEEHHGLARRAAEESIVLLKNEGDILPLSAGAAVTVIGDFARVPRYQGAGSSLVNPSKTPEAVVNVIGQSGLKMEACAQGYVRNRGTNQKLLEEAVAAARSAQTVLVFAGLDEINESEGMDRVHMRMPAAQNELIEAVADVNANVIVILSAGSAVEMPWLAKVKAVVHGYLGGQAGASAMLRVLTGECNPSGKLNETYPYRYEDTPACVYWPSKERSSEYRESLYAMLRVLTGECNPSGKLNETYPYRYEDTPACVYWPSKERSSEYRESLYVGYRYYTTVGREVCFPFGYGLSYTSFAYENLRLEDDRAMFTLRNVGARDGAEIAQLYIGRTSETVFRPAKELKGFAKVFLKAGEEKEVVIPFDDKTFRFFDVRTNTWETERGNYTVYVGRNVEDTPLAGEIYIEGTVADGGYDRKTFPHYFSGKITDVSAEEYCLLYGKELPDGSWGGEIGINDAVCQLYYGKGILGKLFCGALRLLLKNSERRGKPDLNVLFNYNMPIRGYAKMTNGLVTMDMARALTEMTNGHRIRGTGHLIQACFKR